MHIDKTQQTNPSLDKSSHIQQKNQKPNCQELNPTAYLKDYCHISFRDSHISPYNFSKELGR